MKSVTTRQKQWLDSQVPPISRDADGELSMSKLVDDLYKLGGVIVDYTSNGTADTADAVTHNLGRDVSGYVVIKNGNGGVVYDGGGTTNTTVISLKCTTASNDITLLVF